MKSIALLIVTILGACNAHAPTQLRDAPAKDAGVLFPVTIHEPLQLVSMSTGRTDPSGNAIRVRCDSCHELGLETQAPQTPADAEGPHKDLIVRHGELACIACHDSTAPHRGHLATGETFPMSEAMRLCRQCHGTHARDYDHGAHGGMQGYWDLTRGPRVRNNCTDCHDPHKPTIGPFVPMPAPRDRIRPAISAEGGRYE